MTLVCLTCAWLLGIYIGSLCVFAGPLWPAASIVLLLAALALHRRPHALRPFLFLLALALGGCRFLAAFPRLTPGELAQLNDTGTVVLRGLVVNDPVARDRTADLVLAVRHRQAGQVWEPASGLALVRVPSFYGYRYGDLIQVSGDLETPSNSGSFSYRAYLARQGIHSLMPYPRISLIVHDQGRRWLSLLCALARRTREVISAILPEPQAALLSGILVGSDEGIPQALMDQFRATGTAHIIAISGFNITLICAALVRIFSRLLQRYVALVVAVVAIAAYSVLVGAEPPVLRAATMGGLSALALLVGRRDDALTSLFAAALLLTLWQPFLLWEVSAQLSFMASLGLIVYGERLQAGCQSIIHRLTSLETAMAVTTLLRDALLSTLAATITSLPLMILYFGFVSPLSLLANLLILPLQPAVMYIGATCAMTGLLWLPLGRIVGALGWLPLTYTIRVVEALAPAARMLGSDSSVLPGVIAGYYALLAWATCKPGFGISGWRSLRSRVQTKVSRRWILAALAAAAILPWAAGSNRPDGRLHVHFLDVGQGDAILVETPTGRRLLIDGGPSPAALLSALGRRMPFWDRRIDLVMLTHPHDDHVRGLLALAERYEVRQAIVGVAQHDSAVYQEWLAVLQEKNVSLMWVGQPLHIDLGDGPTLDVIPPPGADPEDLDANSLVARLTWGDAVFVFTGDCEAQGLEALLAAGWSLRSTVLKVPHHGSEDSLSDRLLAAASPQLDVISVGAENRFGHPSKETLALLEKSGVRTLRTDANGAISVTTDGERLWVEPQRER